MANDAEDLGARDKRGKCVEERMPRGFVGGARDERAWRTRGRQAGMAGGGEDERGAII